MLVLMVFIFYAHEYVGVVMSIKIQMEEEMNFLFGDNNMCFY
jgi:hypothetical protein